jgi:hypothetical protein
MAELPDQARYKNTGVVPGALLTKEILTHLAVGSISLLVYFEKAPYFE